MKTKDIVRSTVVAAVAAAFVAAPVASFAKHHHKMVHCYGVNGCKGQADCKGAKNSCKGKNKCKGMGAKKMSAKECKKKGGHTKAE